MKILFISFDRHLFEAGSESRIRIARFGFAFNEVHLIVFAKKSLGFQTIQIAPNVWVHPTNSWSRWLYITDAIRLATRLSVDCVSAQDPYECGLAAWNIATKKHIPWQIQLHIDPFDPYFVRTSCANRIRSLLAQRLLPETDFIRAVSQRIVDSLKKKNIACRNEPVILPVFIDIDRFLHAHASSVLKTRYPQFGNIILMASRLVPQKDMTTALAAFHSILQRFPKTGLVIAGDGPEKKRIVRYIKAHAMEKNVVFEPWQTDVLPFLTSSDIFLLTSLYEGFGRTIVEAAAAGVPVVTTDVGIVGSFLKDKEGILVSPVGSSAIIAKHLCDLLENQQLHSTLRAAAKQVLSNHPFGSIDDHVRAMAKSCIRET